MLHQRLVDSDFVSIYGSFECHGMEFTGSLSFIEVKTSLGEPGTFFG